MAREYRAVTRAQVSKNCAEEGKYIFTVSEEDYGAQWKTILPSWEKFNGIIGRVWTQVLNEAHKVYRIE